MTTSIDAPEPDGDEVMRRTGRLEKGPFYADDFLIGKLHCVDEDGMHSMIEVKGYMPDAMFGEQHELIGKKAMYKGREQMEFTGWRVIIPTKADQIGRYLAKSVKWVGNAIAKRITGLYGDDSLMVLRDDPIRVGREIDGLNEAKAHEIASELTRQKETIEARIKVQHLLAGSRISSRLVERILKKWKTQAPIQIEQNPYALIEFEGIGFPTADAIAVNRVKYPKDGEFRKLAAARHAMQELANGEGHTVADKMTVISMTQRLIGHRPTETVLEHSSFVHWPPAEGAEEHRDRMQLAKYGRFETIIANKMRQLCGPDEWPHPPSTKGLHLDQKEALQVICSNRVSVLDGLPGTGKSVLVGRILEEWGEDAVRICAPTGKAAKRMQEIAPEGMQAMTIHRAIGLIVGNDEPRHTEKNPMAASLIVIDEFSMVDTELAAFLFSAIRPDARVLIVGDPFQLSPVRAGCVLRDFIRYGVARASLRTIKRNAGALVLAIHAVSRGEEPQWPSRFSFTSEAHNLRFIHCGEEEIYAEMLSIFKRMRYANINPVWDCQVMTPVNDNGQFCRKVLNDVLGPKLLPVDYEHEFRIGEKVIQCRNQKVKPVDPRKGDEVEVVNGDVGCVLDIVIDTSGKSVRRYYQVQHWYPDREVLYEFNEHGMQAAYALTVHKCQGSGFPWVIIPLHRSQGSQVLSRNWIYTAMSRAEKGCIFVGDIAMFDRALPRVETNWRTTRLVERMEEAQVPRGEVA